MVLSVKKSMIVAMQMEMIKRFGPKTMERGWKLYQGNRVQHVKTDPPYVTALVTDKRAEVQVRLNTDQFVNSRCTCSKGKNCHHMAALFFTLYGEHEKRPELFLMQHHQMRLLRSKEREERRRKRKESPDPTEAQSGLLSRSLRPDDPISVWQDDIDKKFSGYFDSPSRQVESFVRDVQLYTNRISGQWSSPNREFYQALSWLFVLVLAENRYLSTMDGYQPQQLTQSFLHLFDLCAEGFAKQFSSVPFPEHPTEKEASRDRFHDQIHMKHHVQNREEIHKQHLEQGHNLHHVQNREGLFDESHERIQGLQHDRNLEVISEPYLEQIHRRIVELSDWLHRQVFRTGESPVRWLDVYRAFGWKLASDTGSLRKLLNREKSWLSKEMTDSCPADKLFRLELGLLHILFIEDGQSVLNRLFSAVIPSGETEHLFPYAEHAIQEQNWTMANLILTEMLPHIRNHSSQQIKSRYLGCWEILRKHIECGEQWTQVLRALLPYSMELYAEHLAETEQYRLWIDLQLVAGRLPDETDPAILAKIQKEHVELLIPFYHQAVSRSIMEKKRDSYRLAAELLIQLRACYKQLHQEEVFETFMKRLVDHYRILRAFMEELKRSHLIS